MKNRLLAFVLSLFCAISVGSCGNKNNTNKLNDLETVSESDNSGDKDSKEDISFKEETDIKVKQVALGENHSAAVTETGNLYLWGSNYRGQLGNGSTSDKKVPEGMMGNVKYVSLGYNHSAAVTEDGDLYLWGDNKWGQLGDGSTESRERPKKIMENVKSVSLGYEHSAAITEDGSLYVWGRNSAVLKESDATLCKEPVKIMDNVKYVSLGSNLSASLQADNHSAAITENGELFMWGYNNSGQLGDGTYESRSEPIKIMDDVKSVSLGYNHSAAITDDGKLYLWGDNYCGQIGDRSRQNRYEPVEIMTNVKEVSLGWRYSSAITNDGDLYLWGDNYYGQLGNFRSGGDITSMDEDIESKEPIKILSNISTVSLGSEHSAAVTSDGVLYLWGSNKYGQIGSENDYLFSHGYNEYGGIGNVETVYIDHPIQILPNEEYISQSYKTESDNSDSVNDLAYQNDDDNSNVDTELKPNVHYYGNEDVNGVILNYDLYMLPNKTISITTPTETGGSIDYRFEVITYTNGVYTYTNGVESEMVPGALRSLVVARDLSGEIRIIDNNTIEWTNIANSVGRSFSVILRK